MNAKTLGAGAAVLAIAILAGFAGGRSCAPPTPLPPDKPLPPASIDAGVAEARIDEELRRRLDEIEGRVGEIEAEQARRRAGFANTQRTELARVRDGGRGAVAGWLNDFDRSLQSGSSSSP